MALSADNVGLTFRDGDRIAYRVKASTTIYKGALVVIEAATGYAIPAASSAGNKFVGVALEKVVQSASSAYDVVVELPDVINGLSMRGSITTQCMVGVPLYVADDETLVMAICSSLVLVGWVSRYISKTSFDVRTQVDSLGKGGIHEVAS